MNQFSQSQKQQIHKEAEAKVTALSDELTSQVAHYEELIEAQKDTIPEFKEYNLKALDGDSEFMDQVLAKIGLYTERRDNITTIKSSPYFVRLDVKWKESGKEETIFIGKHALLSENIYSWVSPIATLRFAQVGEGSYTKPEGEEREGEVRRKDSFMITGARIVFMTSEDELHERQVIFQQHMEERREFLLPEIVAALDKLQDEIIRSDPHGHMLIAGPAGSGKTTLALHRVAYLVLNPEFRDFFEPEKIIVFVADDGAISYFGSLLPELGINGVQITTFPEWATMIANSRFKARVVNRFRPQPLEAALDFTTLHNPISGLHPRLLLSEYKKLKQQVVSKLDIHEGSQQTVYPALHDLYTADLSRINPALSDGFLDYLKFQEENKYLDEVDLTILLMSLTRQVEPYAHVVIDEAQNWQREQLEVISSLSNRIYSAVTYIGDPRQKTNAFSIQSWEEMPAETKRMEILKVYRNTRQILEHLKSEGYDIDITSGTKSGKEVIHTYPDSVDNALQIIEKVVKEVDGKPLAILAKYKDQLVDFSHLSLENENVHVLTIEEAQGLEFHTVIIIDASKLKTTPDAYSAHVSILSAEEYSAQDKHLYYVAATRAQEELVLIN